ncbi:MAG: response regulator transcription factor [Acidobacteriota bacterium]
MNNEISIILADDHPFIRQGLRATIEREPNLKVLAEAGDGRTAVELIQTLRPQVAILDIDMPELDGFAVARAVRQQKLPLEIIFLTLHREEEFFKRALELDAKGYVTKDSAATDIISGIRAVAAGQHYVSPALASFLVSQRRQTAAPHPQGLASLSPTERQVIKLIAEYKTSKEIAEALGISPLTVKTHRQNICLKLDLQGNHSLMKFALENQSDL